MVFYVDCAAKRGGDGSKSYPFKKISDAAKIAKAGDEVIVANGVYREYVDPANKGEENARIIYRAAEKGGAVITGAERVQNWKEHKGDVWVC